MNWISVRDKEPDTDLEGILIHWKWEDNIYSDTTFIEIGKYKDGSFIWFAEGSCCEQGKWEIIPTEATVIHWMNIPDKPKGF